MRIPVDALRGSSVSWLIESNGLLTVGMVLLIISFFLLRKSVRPSPTKFASLLSVGVAFFTAGCAVEVYFFAECPVRADKMASTEDILRANQQFFEQQPSEWSAKYPSFLGDGTLLCVVRKYEHLMPWDQDTDYYLMYDLGMDPGAEMLMEKLRNFHKKQYKIVYFAERKLVQVRSDNGGHGDIWIWERKQIDGHDCLYNPDFTFDHLKPVPQCQPTDIMVPPNFVTWNLGGNPMRVPIPKDAAQVCTFKRVFLP